MIDKNRGNGHVVKLFGIGRAHAFRSMKVLFDKVCGQISFGKSGMIEDCVHEIEIGDHPFDMESIQSGHQRADGLGSVHSPGCDFSEERVIIDRNKAPRRNPAVYSNIPLGGKRIPGDNPGGGKETPGRVLRADASLNRPSIEKDVLPVSAAGARRRLCGSEVPPDPATSPVR